VQKGLMTLLLGLLVYSGFNEANRAREAYATASVPRWRSAFAMAFRDMRNTSPTSKAMIESIGAVDASTVILTDYRALYIRYLTGARAYAPQELDCANWRTASANVLILIGAKEMPPWVEACLKENAHWKLLRPTGRAAPSMYAD
jgi:hypothetical protein